MKKLTVWMDQNMEYIEDACMHSFATKEAAMQAATDPAFKYWYGGPNGVDTMSDTPDFVDRMITVYSSLDEWKNVFAKNYEQELRNNALAKLTDEEKRVLGLNKPDKKAPGKKK